MPNPWTGKGNPYTRQEVRERLKNTIDQKKAIIAAGAGTGISAKFIEKGGADLTHGGPVNTPDDVREVLKHTTAHGFVGASSLERMGVEQSLTDLTRDFKSIGL